MCKIVEINKYYFEYLKKNGYENINDGRTGIILYIHDRFVYAPLSFSKERITTEKRNGKNNAVHLLNDGKFGIVKIRDYIYVEQYLWEVVLKEKINKNQVTYLRKDEKKIIRKLEKEIARSSNDNNKKELYENYFKLHENENKNKTFRYLYKAIDSMKLLEHLKYSFEDTESMIEYKMMEKIDTYDFKT